MLGLSDVDGGRRVKQKTIKSVFPASLLSKQHKEIRTKTAVGC